MDANAIDTATWSVAFAAGTALGGVLTVAGPVLALTVDAGTFALAALVLSRLPPMPAEATSAAPKRHALVELREAWRYAWRRPALAEAVLAKAPAAVAGGAAWILLNLSVERVGLFGSAALALGLLQAVRGVGTAVGPLAARALVARGLSGITLLRASLAVTLVGITLFTVLAWRGPEMSAWLPSLLVAAFVWGMGSGGYWVFSVSEIQRRAPDAMQGRLSSIDQLSFMLGSSGGAIGAALLVDATGIAPLAGVFGVLTGGALWLLLIAATVRQRRLEIQRRIPYHAGPCLAPHSSSPLRSCWPARRQKKPPPRLVPAVRSLRSVPAAPKPTATATAVVAKPSHPCPKGSEGAGTGKKPCIAKGATRIMDVKWTGKISDKGPSFRVTNKADLEILYGSIVVYFYDKAGKQLEVDRAGKKGPTLGCSGNIFAGPMKAGEKATLWFSCVKKASVPAGTVAIEAELKKVGFTAAGGKRSDTFWQNSELSPKERPKGGIK